MNPQMFAPYLNRVGAAILDGLIVGIPIFILSAIAGAGSDVAGAIVYLVLIVFGVIAYYAFTMSRAGANNGQTTGKQVLNIRVIHQSGAPMDFGKSILRELVGKSLPSYFTCGLYGILDALWPLFDDRKQALHDKIGSTFVVNATVDASAGPQLGAGVTGQAFPQGQSQEYGAGTAPEGAAPPPPPPPPPSNP